MQRWGADASGALMIMGIGGALTGNYDYAAANYAAAVWVWVITHD